MYRTRPTAEGTGSRYQAGFPAMGQVGSPTKEWGQTPLASGRVLVDHFGHE